MAIVYCGPVPSGANTGDSGSGGSEAVNPGITSAVIASDTAPSDINVLWVDTAHTNLLKYFNKDASTWTPVSAAWG